MSSSPARTFDARPHPVGGKKSNENESPELHDGRKIKDIPSTHEKRRKGSYLRNISTNGDEEKQFYLEGFTGRDRLKIDQARHK